MEKNQKKSISPLPIVFISIAALFFVLILVVSTYFSYVFITYSRIPDNQTLQITESNKVEQLSTKTPYSITTFNIGFGAYNDEFDFFMDDGYLDQDGKIKTKGTHARALSKNHVLENINGASKIIKSMNPDFALFQEVDTDSTRSYHINQEELIKNQLPSYNYTKAVNYHSAYLCYPFNEPIGKSNSQIMTYSKAKPDSSLRKMLPLSASRIDNLVDLDRCMMINRYKIQDSEKELVIINVHLSAYDEGGFIRRKQTELLGSILEQEKSNENYVIVGGDFNQVLIPEGATYFIKENGEITPNWVANWEGTFNGYTILGSKNGDDGQKIGTARNNTKAYDPNWTYTCAIDGFIVSDNIQVDLIQTITSHAFKYSDHNPVILNFSLQ